jgi:hypothetical protein
VVGAGVAAAIVAATVAAHGAPRLSVASNLELGAGYDDNLFLNPNLVGSTNVPLADGILHVQPRVLLSLGTAGHLVAFGYDLIWHQPLSGNFGSIADHLFTLEYRTPALLAAWLPMWLRAAAIGERYDATFTSPPDPGSSGDDYDAFWLGGGEVGLGLLTTSGRGSAAYRLSRRAYPNRDQNDTEQRVMLGYEHHVATRLVLGASYGYLALASAGAGTADMIDGLARHRGSALARLDHPDASFTVEPWAAAQTLPHFSPMARHDWLAGVSLGLLVRAAAAVDLFARYEYVHAGSDDPSGTFARNQALVGMAVHAEWASGPATPSPEQAGEDDLRPLKLPDGRVRFRLRAPAARQVAVVGDWNGWDPALGAMARLGPDLYELTCVVPPGRHAYSFLVDGRTVRPPGAEAYSFDGFGGENGFVSVPP